MTRKINQAGRALIQSSESFSNVAYPDPGTGGNPWTIAWGHTHEVKKGDTCTQAQGDQWFEGDLEFFENEVSSLVQVPLNDNEFSALVSLAYNLKPSAFRQSSVIKYVNAGAFAKVPAALMDYDHSAGRVMPGLVKRRRAEGELWLKGSVYTPRTSPTAASALRAGSFLLGGVDARLEAKIWPSDGGTPTGVSPADQPDEGGELPPTHVTLSVPLSWIADHFKWHAGNNLPQTPEPPLPEDLRRSFLSGLLGKKGIPMASPASGFSLTGLQKILIGLGMALLPTVINYVTGINWQDLGVSAQTASLISGSLAMVLHMIPRPSA